MSEKAQVVSDEEHSKRALNHLQGYEQIAQQYGWIPEGHKLEITISVKVVPKQPTTIS